MDYKKELQEAVAACDRSLAVVDEALVNLNSARNWGIFDMLGGGFISSMIKRGKIKEAEALFGELESSLKSLEKETRDVQISLSEHVETSDLMIFFDVVFDNIVVDWMVQSDIKKNIEKLYALRESLEKLKGELLSRLG